MINENEWRYFSKSNKISLKKIRSCDPNPIKRQICQYLDWYLDRYLDWSTYRHCSIEYCHRVWARLDTYFLLHLIQFLIARQMSKKTPCHFPRLVCSRLLYPATSFPICRTMYHHNLLLLIGGNLLLPVFNVMIQKLCISQHLEAQIIRKKRNCYEYIA